MSKYFKESNKESAASLFNKSTLYKSITFDQYSQNYDNLTSFVAEKLLYGRVSKDFTPIVLPKNSTNLKTIPTKSNAPQNLRALNFVVDAFSDMQKHFQKSVSSNKIKTDDPYLSNLQVYKAYIDPYDHYQKYLNKLVSNIYSSRSIDAKNLKKYKYDERGIN